MGDGLTSKTYSGRTGSRTKFCSEDLTLGWLQHRDQCDEVTLQASGNCDASPSDRAGDAACTLCAAEQSPCMMPKAASDREERSYDPVLASESDEEYDEDSLSSDGGSRAPARSRAGGRGKGMSTSRHAQQSVQPPKRRRRQPDDPEKKNIR
eukprot:1136235-Pelagomonas_calceolata.AAC.2